ACESQSLQFNTDSLFLPVSETNIARIQDNQIIKIFPNPSDSGTNIHIDSSLPGEKTIMIYSIEGNLIQKHQFQNNIEITNLQAGVYIVQIYNNGNLIGYKKLVRI
ncbi:MAG: T9SS type A sorting domain-containing protein, partial [Bacteroidota bacterium]